MRIMDFEKPARVGQWQERGSIPINTKAMTKADIEEYRKILVKSYKCEDSDITHEFQKVAGDENCEFLWLKYKMKYIANEMPTIKEIFSIKIPVPPELRKIVEIKRQDSETPTAPARPRPTVRK